MSQKRKLKEYRDPDYPHDNNEKISKFSEEFNIQQIDRKQRIYHIISREFENEINCKEREVYEINEKISIVKKMLHKVCFAVIYNYYSKRSLNLGTEEITQTQENISKLFNDDTKGLQSALHPSLKKILGSNEVNYKELLNSRPIRQAAKTAQTTIKEKFKTKKEMRIERQRMKVLESIQENVTVDECLNQTTIVKESSERLNSTCFSKFKDESFDIQNSLKNVQKLNTDRGINLIKQIITVGNTSKFIKKESLLDRVSHKWLIYVQSKTEIPIEKFVKKVKFYLHPSYKPNDIVDVDNPPFQLSRRGWGEFPVRIQLFFHSKFQQKPVQLFHNLVLDKTLTGLQTMGSETLVELWLRSSLFSPHKAKPPENNSETRENFASVSKYTKKHQIDIINDVKNKMIIEKSVSPLRENKDNLIDFLGPIDASLLTDLDSIEPTLILSPTTHSKLKISEAINSPIIQSKSNPQTRNIEQLNMKCEFFDTNINSEINIELISNNNYNQENETKTLFIDNSTTSLPLNIKKINQKLKESLENEKNLAFTNKNSTEFKLPAFNNENHLLQLKNNNNSNTCQFKFNRNKNQIILKDGKVSIIDPLQTKLKKRKQISLLKPVIRQSQSNINPNKKPKIGIPWIIDHDYTSPWKDEIDLQTKNILNKTEDTNDSILGDFRNKLKEPDLLANHDFISVVISNNTKQLVNLKKKITLTVKEESNYNQKTFVDYRGQFELKFHSKKFITENSLIEYCLKNVPLINSKATEVYYRAAFPFVVENCTSFRALPLPKRRALEWLQCKYFSTLMHNHGTFSQSLWTTKEIILYARSYGFSPKSLLYDIALSESVIGSKSSTNLEKTKFYKDIGTQPLHIIDEIYRWINEFNNKIENDQAADEIDVDDDMHKPLNKINVNKSSPIKYNSNSIIIPIQGKFHEESKLIKEICSQINIELKPELLSDNVQLHAPQLILIKILRKFIENLIRKSIFEIKNTSESIPVVQVEHVKRAVLSNSDFEFLFNRIHKNINEIKKELE